MLALIFCVSRQVPLVEWRVLEMGNNPCYIAVPKMEESISEPESIKFKEMEH